jgi:thioredoxin-like negative regulator of GroEL
MSHKGAWALAVLVLAGPAAAQDWKGMGRLEGKVLDPDGKPVEGATVKLDLPERGGGPTLTTDKKGKWAVGGIVAGKWNVDVTAAGFVVRKVFVNLPGESARVPPVEVRLERAAPSGPSPELLAAVQKGDEAYKAGKFAEARTEYEKVLALKPELSATLHEMIARCYSQEGDYAKSSEHLQHVVDADPTNVKLKILLAQEALRANQLDRGMAVLKSIDDTAVSDPEIFYNVAVILLNQNKAEDAIPYLTKSVAIDASYVDGYFQRGLAYLGQGKMAEAKADFQKVMALAPTSPQGETAKKALEQIK